MRKNLIIILGVYVSVLAVGAVLKYTLPDDRDTRPTDIAERSFALEQSPEENEVQRDGESEDTQGSAEEVGEFEKLLIEDVTHGDGLMANPGDTVVVHYTGTLEDGEVFDTSRAAGREPFQFTLGSGQVIEGWERGIPGMRVGGTRKLTIPAHLAYGESGFGAIPSEAVLIFEIELLSVFE